MFLETHRQPFVLVYPSHIPSSPRITAAVHWSPHARVWLPARILPPNGAETSVRPWLPATWVPRSTGHRMVTRAWGQAGTGGLLEGAERHVSAGQRATWGRKGT